MQQTMFLILWILFGAACGSLLTLPAIWISNVMLKKRSLEAIQLSGKALAALTVLAGLAGGCTAWRAGVTVQMVYGMLMLGISMMIALIDAKHRIIPNELVLSVIVLSALFGAFRLIRFDWVSTLIGFAACFILFMLPALMAKKVGAGDVKLAAAMGFALGLGGSMAAVAVMGALVLFYTLAEQRVLSLGAIKRLIPMGPFLAAALVIVQTAMI